MPRLGPHHLLISLWATTSEDADLKAAIAVSLEPTSQQVGCITSCSVLGLDSLWTEGEETDDFVSGETLLAPQDCSL